MEPTSELTVKIPSNLKELLVNEDIDIEKVVREALESAVEDKRNKSLNLWIKVPYPGDPSLVSGDDIPPSHFMRIPNLDLEDYERIVGEDSWEYLDGELYHNSPESHYHNSLLVMLIIKAGNLLNSDQYIIRQSRIALSINEHKPEPDLMIFHRDKFMRKKRKDGSESEIIESDPLLIIEIVSPSSTYNDAMKKELYLTKGVSEYWIIDLTSEPINASVFFLKKGDYEQTVYKEGEIRSRVLPDFAVSFKELKDPDSFR